MEKTILDKRKIMEDIVLIRIQNKNKRKFYILTWGRVFDSIDESLLIEAIKLNLKKFGIKEFLSIEICDSLSEGAESKYFYENFFHMCQLKIPFGKDYKVWCKQMTKKIQDGKELYFLGKRDPLK